MTSDPQAPTPPPIASPCSAPSAKPVPSAPFDALLIDFDGVVHLWDPDGMPALDRRWGLPEGTLAGVAFGPRVLPDAVTGRTTDAQWRSLIADGLAAATGSERRARELVAEWTALRGRVDPEVVALVGEVRRRGVPVVLVSNASTRLEWYLAECGLDGVFDAVVNTARIGVAKPDHRVFGIAAAEVGADPRRCLFVDDTAGHAEAAREAGLTALHYRTAAGLREALAPVLGDGPARSGMPQEP